MRQLSTYLRIRGGSENFKTVWKDVTPQPKDSTVTTSIQTKCTRKVSHHVCRAASDHTLRGNRVHRDTKLLIARQSHTEPLAGAVDGTQTALACSVMLHYVLVNRKFNELKSMILLNSVRFEQGPRSSGRVEALPLAIEQSTTRDAESEKV